MLATTIDYATCIDYGTTPVSCFSSPPTAMGIYNMPMKAESLIVR